ncbi:polysaccharide deacetylase family protein [soil metagenome]
MLRGCRAFSDSVSASRGAGRSRSAAVIVVAAALASALVPSLARAADAVAACTKPVYLTIDTGHMGVAPLVADVLNRQHVKATFFLANEKTKTDGSSLDDEWAPWWKARAAEGHVVGSHTFDHVYWQADAPGGFKVRPSAGPDAGKSRSMTSAQYCEELARPATRWRELTGQTMPKLFRAPGGKTSPALLAAAEACGWQHVPWSPAGFLGDELPSDKYPNATLLAKALRDIRSGDILLMHLGIWSRKDPWAPADLEPLIAGLKERGFCFQTLGEHPLYRRAVVGTVSGVAGNAPVKP